jgi:DNA primase
MIDCIYFWTINKYAIALNGLGNELQFKQLNQMPCRKFILCTDSDEAGMKARTRLRRNIRNKLITEYILPNGRKDANDCTTEELQNLTEVM